MTKIIKNSFQKKIFFIALLTALSAYTVWAPQSIAQSLPSSEEANEPAQMPLLVARMSVAPNIMLILDNSGSMVTRHANLVPLGIQTKDVDAGAAIHQQDNTNFRYPAGSWGATSSLVFLAPSDPDDLISALMRSNHTNELFYNPAVTYRPWARGNNVYLRDSSLTRAFLSANDAISNGSSLDLTGIRTTSRANTTLCSSNYRISLGYDPLSTSSTLGRNFQARCGNSSTGGYRYEPAVYYIYTGPGQGTRPEISRNNNELYKLGNYKRISLNTDVNDGIDQPKSRTDCVKSDGKLNANSDGKTVHCSRDQEWTNFANWFTYYRTRASIARAAASHTFAGDYEIDFRLGRTNLTSGTMHIQGGNYNYIKAGVRSFEETRADFFNWLISTERDNNNGTPTRAALYQVGLYFQNDTNTGPWTTKPGVGKQGKENLECRKSHAILISDGGWNDPFSIANVDGINGSEITGENGQSYTYSAEAPFRDRFSNTLADVAMYFWKTDLMPKLKNAVPTTNTTPAHKGNPAFWQHMVTHTVGLGVSGHLEPTDENLQAIAAGTLNWSNPTGDELAKIDDLWHAAINGRGKHFQAYAFDELVAGLKGILETVATGAVTNDAFSRQSAFIEEDNRIYGTSFLANDWTGNLTSYKVSKTGKRGTVEWDSSNEGAIPSLNARNVWIGGDEKTAIPFKWTNNVEKDNELKKYLTSEQMINQLKGKSSLGDIINSNPLYIKKGNNLGYAVLPGQATGEGSLYGLFQQNMKTRQGMVWVGANDGMLHAFAADGGNIGKEVFAYIPYSLRSKLPFLVAERHGNRANHRYFVDGPLTATEAYFAGGCTGAPEKCWKSVLLGSTGAGARTVFALDVTDPALYSNKDNAHKAVLWELSAENEKDSVGPIKNHLGFVMQPIQAGFNRNNEWVAFIPNGPYSKKQSAALIMVDLKTGKHIRTIELDGDKNKPNGLSGITLIKSDKQVVTGAYGTDIQGNLWRFNMGSDVIGSWNATKIFTTEDRRPIGQAPIFMKHPLAKGDDPNTDNIVIFGTGKYYDESDIQDRDTEYIYGIWDKGGSYFAKELKEDELEINGSRTITNADGTTRTIKLYELDQDKEINWNEHEGWYVELIENEHHRSLYTPIFFGENVVFTITKTKQGDAFGESCDGGEIETVRVYLNAASGRSPNIQWDFNGDGIIDDQGDQHTVGYNPPAAGGGLLTGPGMESEIGEGGGSGGAGIDCGVNKIAVSDGGPFICVPAQITSSWVQLF